jgi:hypothetical protein
MKFQFSKFVLTEKPIDFDFRAQSWKWYLTEDVDIKKMAYYIDAGVCWRNGQYDPTHESFKKQYVEGTRFVVLDFDNCEFTPHRVIERAIALKKTPAMWYYSFSQGIKPGNNFRVVWVLDQLINQEQFHATILDFMEDFGEFGPDAQTKDISRMWYAGSMGVHIISEIPSIWAAWSVEILPHISSSVNLNGGLLEIDKSTKSDYGFNWQLALCGQCDLWKMFYTGRYLNRSQRFVLFNNIKHIADAYDTVIELLNKYKDTYEEHGSNISIQDINRWWNDNTIKIKPIVKRRHDRVTVYEFYRLVRPLF